ncbi:hypothetical protein FS842_008779 [Serendipita sp. 407]|nr:hypothetical protein FRC15_000701 [Serendipita sp. 397]KAG9058482.1 hypothetical protein FS842_008779 [Serendipita sp. 407]
MTSNHILIGNGRLPFDVLIHVFDYYSEHETTVQPLETLLLVCKAWNKAACERPSLWTTYKIRLGDKKTTKRWLSRIHLRLERSGSHTPLHIDITSPPDKLLVKDSWFLGLSDMKTNIRGSVDSYSALKLLEILAGKGGSLCSRWESLRLLLAPGFRIGMGEERIILPLTYPMPALKLLHLSLRCQYSEWVSPSMKRVLFPELPSLDSIILGHFYLENYPDMSHAREITLHKGRSLRGRAPQNGLCNAPNVEALSIFFSPFFLDLHNIYPTLRRLILTGPKLHYGLWAISMPRLEELSLRYFTHEILGQAANLKNIDQVHTIHVTGPARAQLLNERFNSSIAIGRLLGACKGLQTLKADEYILSLLFGDWRDYLQPTSSLRIFLVKGSGEDSEVNLSDLNSTPEWKRVVELANSSEADT